MSEQDTQSNVSRRDFLKLSGATLIGSALPRKLSEIDQRLQDDLGKLKETEESGQTTLTSKETPEESEEKLSQSGIQIIDNKGIKRGEEVVDIEVDSALIKENILSKARNIISPKLYPQVDEMVDKLVISFGSRSLTEVLETAMSRQNPDETKRNLTLKSWLISRLNSIFSLGYEMNGFTFRDSKHPLIYINTSQISNENEMKNTWDHETSHLIYQIDPDKSEAPLKRLLEGTALTSSIDILSSVSTTLATYAVASKKAGVDIKSAIEGSNEKFKEMIAKNMALFAIPSGLLSQTLYYDHFDQDEVNARTAAKDFPTQNSIFKEMIKVIPRSSK